MNPGQYITLLPFIVVPICVVWMMTAVAVCVVFVVVYRWMPGRFPAVSMAGSAVPFLRSVVAGGNGRTQEDGGTYQRRDGGDFAVWHDRGSLYTATASPWGKPHESTHGHVSKLYETVLFAFSSSTILLRLNRYNDSLQSYFLVCCYRLAILDLRSLQMHRLPSRSYLHK